MRSCLAVVVLALMVGCASSPPIPADLARAIEHTALDLVLLGEQHDAPDHQAMHRRVIEVLAARQRLAAVGVEMAEQGASTSGLPRAVDEASVRAALRWQDGAWPWETYRGPIMAAVASGVPVFGTNLPRSQMRAAMADESLDRLLAAPALDAQRQAMRDGHCGLLPESQIGPMARVQIARDRAMARALSAAVTPGKTVVLLAGAGHVDTELGVPQHPPPSLRVHAAPLPARPPQKDYCAEMRRQMTPAAKPEPR
jgi:uncharacterized iron-regulated protein